MRWTPSLGANNLRLRLGDKRAIQLLLDLLEGSVGPADLADPPYRDALVDIGDGHAERLLVDETGRRLSYWPGVWAGRALAYIGTPDVGPGLVRALDDQHWRVRMTAARTLGRLGVDSVTSHLIATLDDPHPRVRTAALVALGRVGDGAA